MNTTKNIYTKVVQSLSSLMYLLAIGFIVITLVSFVYSAVSKQDLTVLGLKPIYIISGSMEDGVKKTEIKKDSLIISKKITEEGLKDLQAGDVITFSLKGIDGMPNADVTHRLVEINNEDNTFISKGDANNVVDQYNTDESSEGYLSTSRIKYKMILKNNWISNVISLIKYKPLVFGLYLFSGLMGLVVIYIINRQLYDKKFEIRFKKK